MDNYNEEEPNELALVLEKMRRKWLSRIQQGGGGGGGCGCSTTFTPSSLNINQSITKKNNFLLKT